MAGKEVNIDKLLIGDLNIQSEFDAMNNELINNNNQDMVKPLLNCARALIVNKNELIKFLLPYYLCRKELKAPKIDDLIYKGLIEEDWNAIKDAMAESSISLISDCQKYKDTMSKESIDRDMGKANRLIYLINVLIGKEEYK